MPSPLAFSGQDINLDNASGFIANNRAFMVIEVSDVARGSDLLAQQGIRSLKQEELPIFNHV
jgi:hypothetical protein